MAQQTQHDPAKRAKAEEMIRAGETPKAISEALGISANTVSSWKHDLGQAGEDVPRLASPKGQRKPKVKAAGRSRGAAQAKAQRAIEQAPAPASAAPSATSSPPPIVQAKAPGAAAAPVLGPPPPAAPVMTKRPIPITLRPDAGLMRAGAFERLAAIRKKTLASEATLARYAFLLGLLQLEASYPDAIERAQAAMGEAG